MQQSPWETIPQQTVNDLVQQTFSLLLDWDASPDASPANYSQNDLSMGVYCDPWQQSAVLVRCSHALATSLTGQLLELAAEDIREADRVDAVGELVNVIAGSLRGLLPVLQSMSVPFIMSPEDIVQLAENGNTMTYRIGTEPFHLYTVMNHAEAAARISF